MVSRTTHAAAAIDDEAVRRRVQPMVADDRARIIEHGVDLQLVDGVAADAGHRVAGIGAIQQPKTGCRSGRRGRRGGDAGGASSRS